MALRASFHDVFIKDLDPAHEGVRVAHMTDVHVGLLTPHRKVRRAVDLINDADVDVVLLTGDYVCYKPRWVPIMGEQLRGLRARAGVVATLGNHDYWTDAGGVERELTANGYDVLRNRNVTLRPRGVPLAIVGVDDAVTRHHDPARAWSGAKKGGTTICLTHCPEVAPDAAERGAHLVVAGHMHGGHVHVKKVTDKLFRAVTRRNYLSGWYEVGGAMLYVNRGVGSSSVPLRAGEGARSEVAVFTLKTAD
jgi:predicted MPP superfamily phosphohydrolase